MSIDAPSASYVDGAQLIFSGGNGSHAEIMEVSTVGSGVGPAWNPARLMVTYPDAGQYFGRMAYIRGYLQPIDNGSGLAQIFVGNKATTQTDGAFEAFVTKEDMGLSSQVDSDPWQVEVKAVYPDNQTVTAIVLLNNYNPSLESTEGNLLPSYNVAVPPGQAKKITYDAAELDIGMDALSAEATIGIMPLSDEDLPKLDTGMTNVTKGPRKGYRFTPRHMKFKSKIKITLPYNKALIPAGHTEDDVRTYFFDEEAGSWKAIERVAVDTQARTVTSLTDHFTDMINATVTVPDHPQAVNFNPTQIKDIKAADPGAQINLIEPPRANNMGDARLSYPIEIPSGRNGLQPQLAVQYNSSGGNGWMGLGWDIPMQAITIDTRWGVPLYDTNLETETYLLNGEQFTPVANRGELKPRTQGKIFHTRVEGQFRRIIRHGSAPNNYWWEVIDKNGTRYIYGGSLNSNAPDPSSVLSDHTTGNIFRWALSEVRDANTNTIRYYYDIVSGTGGEPWRQIYLSRITYTGMNGSDGPYEVIFYRTGERPDVAVDARAGFKTVLKDRLASIDIRLPSAPHPLIRRYVFDYTTGQFYKTVLTKITQYAEDGATEFSRHSFEYFNDVSTANPNTLIGFNQTVSFSNAKTVPGDFLVTDQDSTAFGGTATETGQGHFYGGIAIGKKKEISAGFKVGADFAKTKTKLTLIDINGDGLLDQLFLSDEQVIFRLNTGSPISEPNFGSEHTVSSITKLGEEYSNTLTFGAQAFAYAVTVIGDISMTRTRGKVYLSDVNGDGLPDLVSGGSVYFNRLVDGIPTFGGTSPTPISPGASLDATGMITDPEEYRSDMERYYHLIDPIRKWVAPYSGTISITGDVALVNTPPSDYRGADGVRAAIQHNSSEIWSEVIDNPADTTPRPITGIDAISVRAGDRIYFRVNSRNDGSYDEAEFNPTITYIGADTTTTDENGQPIYVYNAGFDYAYGGSTLTWKAPVNGTAILTGDFIKDKVTTDDVTLKITQNGNLIFDHAFIWDETGSTHVSVNINMAADDDILIQLHSDTRIDITDIQFAPTLTFTEIEGASAPRDQNGNPLFVFYPPVTSQIYPENQSDAPYTPFVADRDGILRVILRTAINTSMPNNYDADLTLAIKHPRMRFGKELVEIRGGAIVGPSSLTIDIPVNTGDTLYLTADSSTHDITDYVTVEGEYAYLADTPSVSSPAPVDIHLSIAPNEAFGGGFRRWYFGQYSGNATTASIDESLLRLPQVENDNISEYFVGMIPFLGEGHWRAQDKDCWIGHEKMSATRLMVKRLDFPDGADLGSANGVVRMGGGKSRSVAVSAGIFGQGFTRSFNWSDVDFFDFNGDRYPDVVGGGKVQATLPNGGMGSAHYSMGAFKRVRYTESENTSINLGTTGLRTISNVLGITKETKTEQASYNLDVGMSGGKGETKTKWDLMDINGDGLPDYVAPGDNGLQVRLNLGYRFGETETLSGTDTVRREKTSLLGFNVGAGAGNGFTTWSYSFGGGAANTLSKAGAEQDIIDINGDGLLDIVYKPLNDDVESDSDTFTVQYNTGFGFTAPYTLRGAMQMPIKGNAIYSRNIGLHFSIAISTIPPISIILNPGLNIGESLSGYEVMLSDFNGDGYADHIYSDTNGSVEVKLNSHGKTNLLKTVYRPLGSRIELDYTRSGNTTDQPQSRWVLSKSTIFDGHTGDGIDELVTTYSYDNGFYDRAERDFYGYKTVIEEHRNASAGNALFRAINREYLNATFYNKGLLINEITQDSLGRKYLETINTYNVVPVDDNASIPGLESFTETRFPKLTRADRRFYEGNSTPAKSTYTTHAYDDLGNIITFFDAGDTGASDDIEANISYSQCPDTYIVGKANSIKVYGNGQLMRNREAAIDCSTGNLLQVRQSAEGGAAITDLSFYPNGNLQTVTGPSNKNNQRYSLTYEYDPVVSTHVTRITDSFGYTSTATHNFKYGRPETTTDLNNNKITYVYDPVGRVSTITGPYEQGSSASTITFEYHPEAVVPYAITRHIDKDANGTIKDTIDTILFIDGLKRVLQTKKDATVSAGDAMIVSGRVRFDHVGRTTEQYYPITEAKGTNTNFNSTFDSITPTRMEYDILDRNTKTTIPDGTSTQITYGLGTDRNGATQFETIVTDANNKQKSTYRDVRELITSIKEYNQGAAIWTSYAYDPLKQITKVIDDKNNTTTITYDNLGRRTTIDNPDTGKTETQYDLASNVTAKITANLKNEGKQINYDYEYNRLKSITYPNYPNNNITYEYGASGASDNRAGRITKVTDQSGKEERFYGKLGEITKEVKSIITFTTPNAPEVYTTQYQYDTWGRLQKLTYPDGEVLTYQYDSGGLLKKATGVKSSYTYEYIKQLEYDKFEQRTFIEYGNNVRTNYTYDPLDRRLSNLKTGKGDGNLFQNLNYGYDNVGNILSLANDVPIPSLSQFGGPTTQSYAYDDLYRLTGASGTYQFNPGKTDRYGLVMAYDSIHNIITKQQAHEIVQPSNTPITQKKTTYAWVYSYSAKPHAPTHIGERTFTYDKNGNQMGWAHDQNGTSRSITWDEENRIQSIFDNGHEKAYKYNDAGERIIKRGPQGETVYVNQYFTIRNKEIGTKHIYAGTTRIVSKLMKQDKPGSNTQGNTPVEKDVYFYHPDHLGSSNYITDTNGKLYEHLEYFPFGETWIEEATNTQRMPYLFTSKELDEETGLYYYGARYYDPRTSVWQSADPILGKYLPSFRKDGELVPGIAGGVLEPTNLALYTYGRNNPLRLVDPDGKWPPAIHEQIIDRAFPGLTQEQRQILKDRSAWVDRPAGQTKAHNHEHAMKTLGEDPVTASRVIDQNIKNHEEAAKKTQGGIPESVSQIKPEAMKEFGEALHPVTDRTSPAHTDAEGNPRDWRGIPTTPSEYSAARQHEREEATISPEQMKTAVGAARESFGRTFGLKALQEAITPPKQE